MTNGPTYHYGPPDSDTQLQSHATESGRHISGCHFESPSSPNFDQLVFESISALVRYAF
jgi:hypothetical protein